MPLTYKISTEYIELFKLLKASRVVQTGGEAKMVISEGLVQRNGEVVTQKKLKIRPGDVVLFEGEEIVVE